MSDDKQPGFEQSLQQLEELVNKLETTQPSLDESIKLFKQGLELTRRCQRHLDEAQQTVETLLDPGDETSVAPLADASAETSEDDAPDDQSPS